MYHSYLLPVTFKHEGRLHFWSFSLCHFHWCPSLLFLELHLNIQLSQIKKFNFFWSQIILKYSDKYGILLPHTSLLCRPSYQKYSLLILLFPLAFILALFLNNIYPLSHLFHILFTDFLLLQLGIWVSTTPFPLSMVTTVIESIFSVYTVYSQQTYLP